ncbi:retrotransposable element Tf2, partial [Tanacetum coccineum]
KIAQVFLDSVYKLHVMPESIVSDKDKVFISAFWKELFKVLKVKLHVSTAYHPQTDGRIFKVDTNFHTSINTTPFEVEYGQAPPIHVPYLGGLSKIDAVDRTLLAREEAIQVLKFHLQRSQNRMKQQADKSRSEREFEVGQASYKLKLPAQAQRHNVFHVSQLRMYRGPPLYNDLITLP